MNQISSVLDLAGQLDHPRWGLLRKFYSVNRLPAVKLESSQKAWAQASKVFGVSRKEFEEQCIVAVRDLCLGHEALFNPLRLNRVQQPAGPPAIDLIEQERRENPCRWCRSEKGSQLADEFGTVRSEDGRVVAQANWARSSMMSGVVFGDWRMHNLLSLSRPDFVSLFATAGLYIRRAQSALPEARFFLCFLNGGPKSAAGVAHCHLQVLGRTDRPFGYAEAIRTRCPADYWQQLDAIHNELGLSFADGAVAGWVNLAPVKERDLVVCTSSLEEGATYIFDQLQALYDHGTNSFTLAAILAPGLPDGSRERGFQNWPGVLWRLVDRGDMRARHCDIGGAELFGSAIVASDPWQVMRWLQGNAE